MKVYKGIYYFDNYKQARKYAMKRKWPTQYIRSYERGCAIQLAKSSCYLGPDNENQLPETIPTWDELKATALHTH